MTAEIIGIVFGNKHGLSREANFNYWKAGNDSKLIDRKKDIRDYLDINTHGYTFYSLDFIEKYVVWSVYKIIFDTQGREASDWLVMSLVFSNEYWINQSFINQANKIFDDFGNEVLVHGRIQKPPYNADDYLNRVKNLAGYLDPAPAYREIDVQRDTKSNRVGIIDITDQDATATICHFYPGSNNSLSEFFFLPGSVPFNLKGSAELIPDSDLKGRYNTADIKSVVLRCDLPDVELKMSYNNGAEKSVRKDTPLYLMPGDSITVRGEALGYEIYPVKRSYSDIGNEPLEINLEGKNKITKYTITTVPENAIIRNGDNEYKSGTGFDLIFDKSYKFTIRAEGYKDKTIELWGSNEKFVTKKEVLERSVLYYEVTFKLKYNKYPHASLNNSEAKELYYSINTGQKEQCPDSTPSPEMAIGDVITFWKGEEKVGEYKLLKKPDNDATIKVLINVNPGNGAAPIKSDGKKGFKIQGKNNPGSQEAATKSSFLSLLKANFKPLALGLGFSVIIAALIIVIIKKGGGDKSNETELIEEQDKDTITTANPKVVPSKDILTFTFKDTTNLTNFPTPTVFRNGVVTTDYDNKIKWNPGTLQEGTRSYTVTIEKLDTSKTKYVGNVVELSKKEETISTSSKADGVTTERNDKTPPDSKKDATKVNPCEVYNIYCQEKKFSEKGFVNQFIKDAKLKDEMIANFCKKKKIKAINSKENLEAFLVEVHKCPCICKN